MKWILRGGVGLVAILAAVAAIGWMLPVGHEASRSAIYQHPPERLYPLVLEQFREEGRRMDIRMEIVDSSPPRRLITRIADPDQPFGGTWTYDLAPEGPGTRLTITERGEVYNPIFRFVARRRRPQAFGELRTPQYQYAFEPAVAVFERIQRGARILRRCEQANDGFRHGYLLRSVGVG